MNRDQQIALKAELLAGHPVTGAYDADPEIAMGQILAENITPATPSKVEYSDVISYMVAAEKIVPLLASSTASAIELKFLADSAKMQTFDLTIPHVAASVNRLMAALVADALMDAADVAAITALAYPPISQNTALNLGVTKPTHITNARNS